MYRTQISDAPARLPKFNIAELDTSRWKSPSEMSAVTARRLERTWPISTLQYLRLWGENPAYWKGVGLYETTGTRPEVIAKDDMKGYGYIKDNPNYMASERASILYWNNPGLHRVLHNITNVNGILYFMDRMGVSIEGVLFDWELNIDEDKDIFKPASLRPDATIVKGGKIVFLETDNGTHLRRDLFLKSKFYRALIDCGILRELGYTEISIVIQSYSRRIATMRRNGCMGPISEYVSYLDVLDNEFHYLPHLGNMADLPGTKRKMRWAVSKAKKAWEERIREHGENPEKTRRDAVAFYDMVMKYAGVYHDPNEDTSIVVPNSIDFAIEKQLRERELAAERWAWNRNRAL